MPNHAPTGHTGNGTSETPSHVPGLNRIGAMLDDLRKNIQQNQKWALEDWVEGAKLLVIATSPSEVWCSSPEPI